MNIRNQKVIRLLKGRSEKGNVKMAMQRMMQEVPNADVIITNPTHFAIALEYDASDMEAPIVIAKGMDYVALKIREIAKENGIITMENKPLARALYEQVEIGDRFQLICSKLWQKYSLMFIRLKVRADNRNRKEERQAMKIKRSYHFSRHHWYCIDDGCSDSDSCCWMFFLLLIFH